jgi:hypothetical protein
MKNKNSFYEVTYKDLLTIECAYEGSEYEVTAFMPVDENGECSLSDQFDGQIFFGEPLNRIWGYSGKTGIRYLNIDTPSKEAAIAYADEQLAVFKRIIEGEPKKIIHEAGACLKCGSLVDMAIPHICEPCDSAPVTVDTILSEREKTHGDYARTMKLALGLALDFENAFMDEVHDSKHVDVIIATVRMICMKLARIACGNPTFVDHWDDIGGYAKKMADLLRGKAND